LVAGGAINRVPSHPAMIPFSILDLSPILAGSDAAHSFRNSLDLAQHAERWGYRRYWLAEHHGMSGIGSSATAVLIGHVAGGTSTIRVGAGGIMLPNHSPLVIAEQFGTLESLYPGRIDLGLGRAPGTGPAVMRALRRNLEGSEDSFPQDVVELINYFAAAEPGQPVRAVPGAGLSVPVWLLGSSLYSAQVAAAFGLPFAFASHFAPQMLLPALETYRKNFRPSGAIERPYAMIGVNVFAADTDAEGRRLFSSLVQMFLRLRTTGDTGLLGPPIDDLEESLPPVAKAMIDQSFTHAVKGSPATVRRRLQEIIAETQTDEIMITASIYDHAARLRSFEIAATVRDDIAAASS
jgi:luciferase family oxidoreductase group 1